MPLHVRAIASEAVLKLTSCINLQVTAGRFHPAEEAANGVVPDLVSVYSIVRLKAIKFPTHPTLHCSAVGHMHMQKKSNVC